MDFGANTKIEFVLLHYCHAIYQRRPKAAEVGGVTCFLLLLLMRLMLVFGGITPVLFVALRLSVTFHFCRRAQDSIPDQDG